MTRWGWLLIFPGVAAWCADNALSLAKQETGKAPAGFTAFAVGPGKPGAAKVVALKDAKHKALEIIPEWSDQENYQQSVTALVDTAKKFGFSDHEIANITDFRVVAALEMARRYQEVKKVEKKVAAKIPKVKKSNNKLSPKRRSPAQKKLSPADAYRQMLDEAID